MQNIPLASSSKGNAYIVESQGALLMIDCGISYKRIKTKISEAGFDVSNIAGVIFTHEHTDHTIGLKTFRNRHKGVPLFANQFTADAIGGDFWTFDNLQEFDIGPFHIQPFAVTHDAADPVGYFITSGGEAHFHATDLGATMPSIGKFLSMADTATLESNHDPVMLAQSDRDEKLKSRIRSAYGHLSNDEAAELVVNYASPRLKSIALAHLSSECNAPHIALKTMRSALESIGRGDVAVSVVGD